MGGRVTGFCDFFWHQEDENQTGSCNIEEKRIWINVELAKKPVYCLEYIVLHEMVHLFVRHHNVAFVGYMYVYMPS